LQHLNDLQYFAQVVRHGGFSAGSRASGDAYQFDQASRFPWH
jgi:hypothetical protein